MKKIKKIDVISCSKVCTLMMGIIGFLAGIYAAFFQHGAGGHKCLSLICPAYSGMGFWAIIIFPLIYAIIGFITGLLIAFIYNLVAGWVGGIEIELEDVKDKKASES